MGQLIEVRIINPDNAEVIKDSFTVTSSGQYNPNDHTPMHREAVVLTLKDMVGDRATLQSITRAKGPEFSRNGSAEAWKYIYDCTILLQGDPDPRSIICVLFAQYKEKSQEDA